MTLSTRSEIITDLHNYMHRDDLDSIAPTFIQQTERYLNSKLRIREMVTEATQAVSGSDSDFALPADFLEMIEIAPQGKAPMEYTSSRVLRGKYLDYSGTPTIYTIVGEKLRFGPVADAAYTFDFDYYAKIPALTDANTTNILTDNSYGDLYLYGCLMFGKAYVKDQSQVGFYRDMFVSQVDELTKEHKKARYGRSGLRQRVS